MIKLNLQTFNIKYNNFRKYPNVRALNDENPTTNWKPNTMSMFGSILN